MRGIEEAPAGGRILLVGELKLRGGQRADRVLDIVESALIERAIVEGYELLNVRGTKTPVHRICSVGNLASRQIAPLVLSVRQRGH